MKDFSICALALSPAIILAAGACYLATSGMSGWGWFLLVVVWLAGGFRHKSRG